MLRIPRLPTLRSRTLRSRARTVTLAASVLAAIALLVTGCGGGEEPVGSVTAEPSEILLGYPESSHVQLTWKMDADLEGTDARPLVFVHLIGDERQVLRTFDHPLPEDWQAGEEISYPLELYQSMLGPPLAQGSYRLTAGIYTGEHRWALDGEEVGRQEYEIARVQAPAPEIGALPKVSYGSGWTPLAAGNDRQVLGSRALGARAKVQVSEAPEAGVLALHFETQDVPEGFRMTRKVEADGDAADGSETEGSEAADSQPASLPAGGAAWTPEIRAYSSCSDHELRISGAGTSTYTVRVGEGANCEIDLVPNYSVEAVQPKPGEEETINLGRLMKMTWTPEG